MPRAWYLIRLIFFGLHYAAWLVYSVLSFVSKPGSRRIMPFVFAGILAWYLADGAFIGGFVRGVTEEDGDPLVAYLMLAIGIGLILAGGTYIDVKPHEAYVDGTMVSAKGWTGLAAFMRECMKVLGTQITHS